MSFSQCGVWRVFQHSAFREQFENLARGVRVLDAKLSESEFSTHPKVKLFKRISRLIFEEIPRDPNASEYRLGNTLGTAHRHWRRAKFLGRFRLFFRFDDRSKIIIYAWINDASTLRKAGAKSDPYHVFRQRLSHSDPPDSWAELLREAQAKED